MKLSVLFQRLEAAALFVAMLVTYQTHHYDWLTFLLLVLVVDVSIVGYLFGKHVGAITYNIGHSVIGPLVLSALGMTIWPSLTPLAVIWLAHVAMDRTLGYGLKETTSFHHTHLGPIGKARKR
jgi:hypothetical protein